MIKFFIKVLLIPLRFIQKVCCCEIPLKHFFKVKCSHPFGIVIGENANIGKNVILFQNVTIGGLKIGCSKNEYPTIEDDVIIYTNSIIVGDGIIPKGTIIPCFSRIILKNGEIYKK